MAAFWLLASWLWGDVMWRVEQDSYVSANAMQMKFLTDGVFGSLFYAARWLLLPMRYPVVGGLLLAAVLAATGALLSQGLRLKGRWAWAAYVLPLLFFAWLPWRGFSLYFRSEPSMVVLLPTLVLGVVAVFAAVRTFTDKRAPIIPRTARLVGFAAVGIATVSAAVWAYTALHFVAALWLTGLLIIYMVSALLLLQARRSEDAAPWYAPLAIPVLAVAAAVVTPHVGYVDSVLATAQMQRLLEEQDWEGMTDVAMRPKYPTRSVAAYYAIALEHEDALLEQVFSLPFDFPKVTFDHEMPADEYALFVPDCNLAAGLLNPAYHEAFEQTVIAGQRLHWLKTMCKAALLNGEDRLVRKYLAVIGANPFEGAFCERIAQYVGRPDRLDEDNEFAHIRRLTPRDPHRFEQNFRKPTFLGYNMGLTEGPDEVLRTSAAACLYSKDLAAFIPRADVFVAKGWPLPECMQQALVIYSIKHGGENFLKRYPGISPMVQQTIAAFSRDVAPIAKDKEAMRRELRDQWLGTYVYYYYCENNNPEQVRKQESAGVN
ncbi:MAG: hypothetical protein J6M53_02990 [Bacteroidaceae bacterium]|nr:hypothetical protein [Bacteroidaceae bacterium]